MGFHFRGWFGAWMAGEGGSAASRARQQWQWWLGRFRRAKWAGLGFYRRMGVTGGRFPSPGRQCGAGGVQNRGSSDWRQWWPAMASWQHRKGGGAWRPPRATGELGFGNTGGARGWFGSGCDAWGGQVASPAYGAARRPSAGRREVEETVSGNFVIRPKFQNPVL